MTAYRAGDFGFTISYDGEETRLIADLLADLEGPIEGEPDTIFGIEVADENSLTFSEDGEARGQHTPGRLLDQLIGRLNRGVVDHSPARLNLHAGCATKAGRTIVLPADRGSGKTTLTSALLWNGWDYLTDEVLGVKPDGVSVIGYPKPLTYKPGTLELFGGLENDRLIAAQEQELRFYVPAGALGAGHGTSATATTIAFPTYTPDAPCEISRLSPAQATSRLVTNSFDFDRRGAEEALLSLARMASACVCVDIAFDDLDDAVAALEELAQEAAPPPPHLEVLGRHSEAPSSLDPPDGFTGDSKPWWEEGVHGVLLGDESVIHHPESKQVAVIDAMSTLMWQAFDGKSTVDELAEDLAEIYEASTDQIAADIVALCESLASHGLVLSA